MITISDADNARTIRKTMHPIFTLIFYNKLIEVITLIQSDPGAVRIRTEPTFQCTPLHVASELGHVEICRYLLDHGAEIDSRRSDGRTALHISCRVGNAEITRLLLSRGADIAAVCNRDVTSLPFILQHFMGTRIVLLCY